MPSLSVRLFIITLLSLLSLLFTPVLLSRDATGVLQIRAAFTPLQQQNGNNAPITPVPVEPETSYPYVVHMRHFALNVGNYCWGYAPGDPDIVGTYPECASLDRYLSGLKFVAPSGNGYVEAANNLPTTDGGPRWGYAYSFFLNNPGAERTITLPIGGCNDVALYTSTGTVQAERLAENSTTVYHRFPGGPTNSDLIGCPCEHLNPTISIPSGPFRLTAITRGAFCTSYLRIGTPDTSWVPEAGLEIDWNGLYAYVGAQ